MANEEKNDSDTSELVEEVGQDKPAQIDKAVRREKEKNELLASLANADFSAMKTRVAAVR